MSEITKNQKLVQVTSIDVLLDNDTRITWQGFRPAGASKKNLTTYYSTLPGNGTGSTAVNLVEIGAQSPATHPVELTLIAGKATLDGAPLELDRPVMVAATGGGAAGELVFSGDTCTLKVCPKAVGTPQPDARVKSGPGGGNSPPPPYPGGNHNH